MVAGCNHTYAMYNMYKVSTKHTRSLVSIKSSIQDALKTELYKMTHAHMFLYCHAFPSLDTTAHNMEYVFMETQSMNTLS